MKCSVLYKGQIFYDWLFVRIILGRWHEISALMRHLIIARTQKGISENVGKITSVKAYVTNPEISL